MLVAQSKIGHTLCGQVAQSDVHVTILCVFVIHFKFCNYNALLISQCATHQNLGWVIQVTDSVLQYLDANGGSDMPTSPPTCPILETTEPPTVTDPVVTDPMVTDPMVTDPMATDPVVTDPVDGSSSTPHTSLPLFVSLIVMNTLALLFI